MSVVVVATIVPKPDQVDEVIRVFTEAIPSTHTEDGCELYALHTGRERLVMIEKWADRDALRAHSRTDAMRALGTALDGLLAQPTDVQVLESVPAGDPARGAL